MAYRPNEDEFYSDEEEDVGDIAEDTTFGDDPVDGRDNGRRAVAAPRGQMQPRGRPQAGAAAVPRRAAKPAAGSVQKAMRGKPSLAKTEEQRRIERENLLLLGHLDQIQKKGGTIKPAGKTTHVAASNVNRRKRVTEIHSQNMALLRRLEGVKSTMAGTGGTGGAGAAVASRRAGRPPPRRAGAPPPRSKKLVQPEWQS